MTILDATVETEVVNIRKEEPLVASVDKREDVRKMTFR